MFIGNVKMALSSIRSARGRSFLTMLGVIIGVVSVVSIVSLGEGLKQQVAGQLDQFGSDLITVRSGKLLEKNSAGDITGVNLLASVGTSTLNERDAIQVATTPGVIVSSPVSLLNSQVSSSGSSQPMDTFVLGTNEHMPQLINQKVEFGDYFGASDRGRRVAVIGKNVAKGLFNENAPLGSTITVRGQDFVIRGVFSEFPSSVISGGIDFNNIVFIPFDTTRQLTGVAPQVYEILAKTGDPSNVPGVAENIRQTLITAHGGQEDFTVLTQADSAAVSSTIVDTITTVIAGIAAISLFVGGIGIMNIMLVAVTERTHEIGIRKAVGASNRQILSQFLIEAAVISFCGGIIGVGLAFLINYLLKLWTSLTPVISWNVVAIALGVSLVVGILFGIAPAIKAARKEPIEALRHE